MERRARKAEHGLKAKVPIDREPCRFQRIGQGRRGHASCKQITGRGVRSRATLLVPVLCCAMIGCADKREQPRELTGADAANGLAVIERVGCAACHRIPGVAWPTGTVGGSLDGFGNQSMIAGRFPNQPQTLAVWVRDAPSMAPATGMPAMPITPAEARDVAAYLYTLDDD